MLTLLFSRRAILGIVSTLMLLMLMSACGEDATATPAFATSSVSRLVVAKENILFDSSLLWKNGGGTHTTLQPMYEGLASPRAGR